jgi:hypothetical protein
MKRSLHNYWSELRSSSIGVYLKYFFIKRRDFRGCKYHAGQMDNPNKPRVIYLLGATDHPFVVELKQELTNLGIIVYVSHPHAFKNGWHDPGTVLFFCRHPANNVPVNAFKEEDDWADFCPIDPKHFKGIERALSIVLLPLIVPYST